MKIFQKTDLNDIDLVSPWYLACLAVERELKSITTPRQTESKGRKMKQL
jgi:hypothetical protein